MSIESPATFDAAQQIPDEYDLFCEECGYSLAGLMGDRCPECGKPFDPKELPFARVPWLHRRRLGKFNAYVKTVSLVCFRPVAFARELCRPVRISVRDARSFRVTTLWLVTIAYVLIGFAFATGVRYGVMPAMGAPMPPMPYFVFGILIACGSIVAVHLFLRLATDMPLFIWKGLDVLSPAELAPIHHYAAAPLAFLPFLMAVCGFAFYLTMLPGSGMEDLLPWISTGSILLTAAWFLWLVCVALVLMRISSRAGVRRLVLMGLYLPLHWAMMLAMSWMLVAVYVMALGFAFEQLRIPLS